MVLCLEISRNAYSGSGRESSSWVMTSSSSQISEPFLFAGVSTIAFFSGATAAGVATNLFFGRVCRKQFDEILVHVGVSNLPEPELAPDDWL